ncbi:MAG: putative zinc-binding protein [Rectinemataceae bacterium]
MPCACGNDAESTLLYACSGAANTGLLADQVMRALNRDKVGDSTCLAAMGADLSGFLLSAKNATRNIVIDGCKVGCGAKIFEKNSIHYQHVVMTDYDVQKGTTAITGELIEAVAERVAGTLK